EAEPLRSRVASRFYRNMLRGAIGAGRVMANAGTLHRATMVNCFVQPLCPPGSRTASARDIEQALADACATLSMGGGVGYDFSPVPPVFAERGDVGLIVRDEHHRNVQTSLQLGQFATHAVAHTGIERGERLVEQ
ncbi:hypothetical protein, partial [Bacillus pumilus]|uniref:hypothetical protein n=1 Tax=Bacillus pumilus TaxID=1408 RepID=UPI001F10BCA2